MVKKNPNIHAYGFCKLLNRISKHLVNRDKFKVKN